MSQKPQQKPPAAKPAPTPVAKPDHATTDSTREAMRHDTEKPGAATGPTSEQAAHQTARVAESSPNGAGHAEDRPNAKRHAQAADPATVAGALAGSTEHVPMTDAGTPAESGNETARKNADTSGPAAPDANTQQGRSGQPVLPGDAVTTAADVSADTPLTPEGATAVNPRTQHGETGTTPGTLADVLAAGGYKREDATDAQVRAEFLTGAPAPTHADATRAAHVDLNDVPSDRRPDGQYITAPVAASDRLTASEQLDLIANPDIPREAGEALIPPLPRDTRLRDMHYREGAVTDHLPLTDAAYRFGLDTSGGMDNRGTEPGYVPSVQPATSGPNTAMEDKRQRKLDMQRQGATPKPEHDPRA